MAKNIHLTNEQAIEKILNKCKEKNIIFIGFDNDEKQYKNDKTKLTLKCNKCGHIWNQTYGRFVRVGRGCPNCYKTRKLTEEELVGKIKKVCEEKNLTFLGFNGNFNGSSTKLLLKCNICEKIWDTATYSNTLKNDRKGHTCGRKNPSHISVNLNDEKIKEKLKEILQNTSLKLISFDENGYIGFAKTKVLLQCKKCEKINKYSLKYIFNNKIHCKNCEGFGRFSNEFAKNEVESKCKLLNYTFIGFDTCDGKYHGKNTYLILKCNKCGHIWKSTTFASFRQNIIKCFGCTNVWKMEKEVEFFLKKHSIKYIHDCRNHILPWLKNKISLSLDFYLPDYKIAIECQGRQHFEAVLDFGGETAFKDSIERDKKKLLLCKENNVRLLYYDSENNHTEFLGEKVYNDETNLLKEITSYE